MKEISKQELDQVFGAGDQNDKLMTDLGKNMAWGAAFGIPAGPTGMAIGAATGAVQTVGEGLIANLPVHVPIPVMIGPSWNGSGKINNMPPPPNNMN